MDIGLIPPTPKLVDLFFDDSSGANDGGDMDFRGLWNDDGNSVYDAGPARLGRKAPRKR